MNSISDSTKALIITLLFSSTVVLMSFNIHLKKKNEKLAETYFEIIPQDELEPDPEELEEILKSLDNLIKTNRAFNETKDYDNFEDEEFRNTLEKIRNRDSRDEVVEENNQSKGSEQSNMEDLASYEDINSIINKRSQKDRSSMPSNADGGLKNSSVSYSLVDRTAIYLPPPIYLCEKGGKVVITIEVDSNGQVFNASYNNASSSSNQCLIDHAIEYARASKFNRDQSRSQQLGTITFLFQGKS
ncbi:MAG: hypothetical protein HKN00_02235 [Flavobacteriaceae bacterium]|nr:hypothetical protein [Bacteroidia bacterium]NNF73974.1 hypothetical protein [Flavobacteriaceae bacterium]NNK72472.1 hypothetical protein [Flavobacteriaceae bacterium]